MSNRPLSHSTSASVRDRRWLSRALLTVVAVIGVVAMHGLTMNHDPAMPDMGAVSHSVSSPVLSGAGHEGTILASPVGVDASDVQSQHGVGMVDAVPTMAAVERGMGGMATACVAFLTTVLLLLGAGRLATWLGRHSALLDCRPTGAWLATAVPRLRPDLGELSVLRT